MVRKSPVNNVVVGLLSFLIVWILDTGNMVLLFFQFKLKMAAHFADTKKKIRSTHKEKDLWSEQLTILFLRKVNFILMFFREELASLSSAGMQFPGDLEG